MALPIYRAVQARCPSFCALFEVSFGPASETPRLEIASPMAQFVYTMIRVGKIVPPKRQILKNISLSFHPGAKIGLLGLNGAGKSTILKIMAGIDKEFEGEAI